MGRKPRVASDSYRPKPALRKGPQWANAASHGRCLRPSAILHHVRLQLTGIGEFRNACVSVPLYPDRLDTAKTCSLLTELESGLRLSVKSEEPEVPDLSALGIEHISPRSWNVPLAAERWQRGSRQRRVDIEVIVRSCATLTPWQLLIRERHESIPMLGNLTLLNFSVNRRAQHCDFAAKRDKLMPMLALVSMSH